MKPYLLDVNVLLALAWPNHVHYREASDWFREKGAGRFRTCPITQTGFVRISSNPAFTAEAVTPAEALELLRRICALPGHAFWPDDVSLVEVDPAPRPAGHRQVTDAYLLALTISHEGILATLDRGVMSVAAGRGPAAVEVIG